MSESTIFEKIIRGEIPSYKIYEDDATYAFLDINPVGRGHTLVIPKEPTRNMLSSSEETFLAVMKRVHMLAPKIKEAVGADGINIGINNEPDAGQEVFHFHVHIIPRFKGDGHKHWGGSPYETETEAKNTQEKIVSLL